MIFERFLKSTASKPDFSILRRKSETGTSTSAGGGQHGQSGSHIVAAATNSVGSGGRRNIGRWTGFSHNKSSSVSSLRGGTITPT
jgi:hypothetical protein